MMTMTPPLPPSETSAVFALIALIADKDACAKRLADLKAQADDIQARYEKLVAASTALEKERADFEKNTAARRYEMQQAQDELSKQHQAHASRVKELTDRDTDLARREYAIGTREKELDARDEHMKQREKATTQAEVAMAARVEALNNREGELNDKWNDYHDRMSKLKALAG